MTLYKVVAATSTAAAGSVVLLLQAATGQPELTGAVLLSGLVLVLLMYVLRRVQAIPKEESLARHDAIDREHATIQSLEHRFDTDLQRLEMRMMGALNEGFRVEREERRTFDQRLRELERELPRRGER